MCRSRGENEIVVRNDVTKRGDGSCVEVDAGGAADNCRSVFTSARTREDIVWGYRTPLPESEGIAGLVCFDNEKVDLEVDGVLQDRPLTTFSQGRLDSGRR